MSIDLQGYIGTTTAPWGKLFYRLVWSDIECKGKRILDFGSGLGITANHFAAMNTVIAVEPDYGMVEHRIRENEYKQFVGSVETLAQFSAHSFDVIICHNVFEYMDNRQGVLDEFMRLIRPDGVVSIIKHHRMGKIMQKVVFENNIDEALMLLDNEDVASVNFGLIHEYEESELEEATQGQLRIDRVYGLRTFYALQRNEWKSELDWLDKMFRMESAVKDIAEFKNIAFFHHVIMKPVNCE